MKTLKVTFSVFKRFLVVFKILLEKYHKYDILLRNMKLYMSQTFFLENAEN